MFGIFSLSNKPGVILTPWYQGKVKLQKNTKVTVNILLSFKFERIFLLKWVKLLSLFTSGRKTFNLKHRLMHARVGVKQKDGT